MELVYLSAEYEEHGVTANTIPGFTRNSAPLWVSGQDAFLVIRRSRDRAQLATQWLFVRRLWKPLTLETPDVIEHAA